MALHTTRRLQNEIVFTINGNAYKVGDDIAPDTTLNTYIRDEANLQGTKDVCEEGVCGGCIVTATYTHPVTGVKVPHAVNSCLLPVLCCHGWAITTVEGVGNKTDGYSDVQTRLMQMNGSQCGYCSPGMVMNMHSLLQAKQPTMLEVENSFGGNLCRCTGYRSIMTAYKSFASDAPPQFTMCCGDIEDIGTTSGLKCRPTENKILKHSSNKIELNEKQWITASTMEEIRDIMKKIDTKPYMLVAGNTAKGVYIHDEDPTLVYININDVKELKSHSEDPSLVLGANMCLTEVMELFYKLSGEQPGTYGYTRSLADHIGLIAGISIRNMATIAGNLCIKHKHKEYNSDIFMILEAVGATLDIVDISGSVVQLNLTAYLKTDMTHKVIKSVHLPQLDDSYHLKTYKIMPRAQNTYSYLQAAFMFKSNPNQEGMVADKPCILFSGINKEFLHATNTETLLEGKNITKQEVLKNALKSLDGELKPDPTFTTGSSKYRKCLAKALFYKFVLSIAYDIVKSELKSGSEMLERPISSGQQVYQIDKSTWPLGQPMPKIEALLQCSGEAKYVNDIPIIPGEVYAAFVTTTVAQGTIAKVDAAEALRLKGVVAFIAAGDIPGKNDFTSTTLPGFEEPEEILCSNKVLYEGQPLGIVVAETQHLAQSAAKLVHVEYKGSKPPLLKIRDALKCGDARRIRVKEKIVPTDPEAKEQAKHVIKGSLDVGGQYQFTLETQTCLCVPIEDGMDVYPAAQWMDIIQIAVSQALGEPINSINVMVRRLGGDFGGKISRSALLASACAVAAHCTHHPVRFSLSMEDEMKCLGKRHPFACDYEVGIDDSGVIKYMDTTLYEDSGSSFNESVTPFAMQLFTNNYDCSTWGVTTKAVLTDTPSNTCYNAPGTLQAKAFVESIMEHIADTLNADPITVRSKNMKKDDDFMNQFIEDCKTSSAYTEKSLNIEEFNKENRWKKRGLSLIPIIYPEICSCSYYAMVSVYSGDGTVAVEHGGIEYGQGLNTKVLQVCAYSLGIPLDKVIIKPSNNLTAPNEKSTAACSVIEACANATVMCCVELLKRLEPVKQKLKDPTWEELVTEAYNQNIDMCCKYMYTNEDDIQHSTCYGVAVSEILLDILTGQQLVLNVHLYVTTDGSINPAIDVGQVEGAFVMGLGYWMMEVTDNNNPHHGESPSTSAWSYNIPGVKDIPIDFNTQLAYKKNPSSTGVPRSGVADEAALCMSVSVPIAVRNALESARKNAGSTEWCPINVPATPENNFLAGKTNSDQFML